MKACTLFYLFLFLAAGTFGQVSFNDTLSKQLEAVLNDDQKYREELENVEANGGTESQAYIGIVKKMRTQDSVNDIKVCSILDRYGWLGADVVGEAGNNALWFVIQHSDLHTMSRYLPMMKEAVRKGNLPPRKLALTEDRMALWQGRKQIYGSQVSWNMKTKEKFVVPIEDPENVDKKRESVGLPPLAEYLAMMNMKWDVGQHKKDMAALEASTWPMPYYNADLSGEVGEIVFDERFDNAAFKTPDTFSVFVKPRYKGGKPAINSFFKDGYINSGVHDANGYVTIHLYVNSSGKAGKFRVQTMDFRYQPVIFDRSVSCQILRLVQEMKGWEPLEYKDKSYGYYCYLNFKIVNGQISCITP